MPEHLPQWGRLGAWREAKRLYAEGERVSVGSARTGQIRRTGKVDDKQVNHELRDLHGGDVLLPRDRVAGRGGVV